MPRPTRPSPSRALPDLAAAVDRLYAAPLDDFVTLRHELAGAFKAAGELPASRLVASTRKPTRTAWALNQVARGDPRLLRDAFEAWDAGVAAQKQGDAARIRATARAYREAVTAVTDSAGALLAKTGAHVPAEQLRRVSATVQAACGGGEEARAKLLAGRLSQDLDVDDPLAGLEAGPPPRSRAPSKAPPARESRSDAARVAEEERRRREREEAERRRQKEARRLVASLERERREAASRVERAEEALARARSDAERAAEELEDVDRRLEEARRAIRTQ